MSDRPNTLSNHPARVSFTVRRPSPLSSRQSSAGPDSNPPTPSNGFKIPTAPRLASNASGAATPLRRAVHSDSSDEDDEETDELVSGFDSMGVQRIKPLPKPSGPLVIPVVENRDWRALARAKHAQKAFIPDAGKAALMTGPDGSQGGLGTKDTINSGPQVAGLVVPEARRATKMEDGASDDTAIVKQEPIDAEMKEAEPLDEDARALQALLKGDEDNKPSVSVIPMLAEVDEESALKKDMEELPDESTLDDYARVPVEEFGMAMLRGMGWKPPKEGADEPWVPSQRPLLLGLGAKQRPADEGTTSKGGSRDKKYDPKRKDRRYVPLVKKEKEGGTSGRSSRASSRSRSPPNRRDDRRRDDRERDKDEGRDRDYGRDRESGRDREKGYRGERDREDRREREDRHRKDDYRSDRESDRERDRDRDRRSRDYDSRDGRR